MDTRDRYAFELGWRLVGMTLTTLKSMPGIAAGVLLGPAWARAFRELRHAEQVARRLLIAEAGRLIAAAENDPSFNQDTPTPDPTRPDPHRSGDQAKTALSPIQRDAQQSGDQTKPPLSPIHRDAKQSGDQTKPPLSAIHREAQRSGHQDTTALSPIHRDAQQSGDQNDKAPGFALFEPKPDPFVLAGLVETGAAERLAALVPGPAKPRDTRGLFRRIRALQAVFDDPLPAARRMARFLLNPRSRRGGAIRPGHPPAFRRRAYLDWSMDVLIQAHDAAMRVLNRRWTGPPLTDPG